MKIFRINLFALLLLISSSVFAQAQKTDTIKVYGNCGMCKNRIQKTLKVEGVAMADWSPETKLLMVTYSPSKISNDDIQKKIAEAGHDTEKYSADDKVYENLPGCCHYKRKSELMKDKSQQKQ